jgi:hypothetical protein
MQPTPSPTLQPTENGDDDDDDSPSGKGGKPSGKGGKPSGKGDHENGDDDDDDDHENSDDDDDDSPSGKGGKPSGKGGDTIPTMVPTNRPTGIPTMQPTPSPTSIPTPSPTMISTSLPTNPPTPTIQPTPSPTLQPTPSPTMIPTSLYNNQPTPTMQPTSQPTPSPTLQPTSSPTLQPTPSPTMITSLYNNQPTPTMQPTSSPTMLPTLSGNCPCSTDSDCIRSPYCPDKCVKNPPYSSQGQCQDVSGTATSPTPKITPSQCCTNPRKIPTECEVKLLIEIMEQAVKVNLAVTSQWIRASYHDAGTFNKKIPQGGANGCLLTNLAMRAQGENLGLDLALETLQTVKVNWEGHPDTCLDVSAADMLQMAGWFSVFRQMDVPGLTPDKITKLIQVFNWGRPDEQKCNISWTANLPGFKLGIDAADIPLRCMHAGGEIKDKMMDRNGFTAIEASALIGAHTIGLTRNVFGSGSQFVSKWDKNGDENFSVEGGKFDNGFHSYLKNDVVADDVYSFASNPAPLTTIFGDWFRDDNTGIGQLDTDIVLAFPSINTTVHPDFHIFTTAFADNNTLFMQEYFRAYVKMSSLGVTVGLSDALPCTAGCQGKTNDLTPVFEAHVKQCVLDAVNKANVKLRGEKLSRAAEIIELTDPVDKTKFVKFKNQWNQKSTEWKEKINEWNNRNSNQWNQNSNQNSKQNANQWVQTQWNNWKQNNKWND